jgi:hypothetical protein
VIAASLFVVIAKVTARFEAATLYDDAFMFQRYARNFLGGRGVVWNPRGAHTYGLTSLWTLLLSVPLRLVSGVNKPALAALLTSLVAGIAFMILGVMLVRRASEASKDVQRGVLAAWLFAMAMCQAPNHFISGMDTSLAMASFTGYLWLASSVERAPSRRKAIGLGVLGGVLFGVRPELALASVLVPSAMSLLGATPEAKRGGRVALGVTTATLALHLLGARLYFGTPLPLPFYAKALGVYGPTIYRTYRGRTTSELLLFLGDFWPLFGLCAVDLFLGARRFLRVTTALDKAVLVVLVALLAYEWLFVLPIMYYDQRFYYPALPPLLFLAARAAGRLGKQLDPDEQRTPVMLGSLALMCSFVLAPMSVTVGQELSTSLFDGRAGRVDLLAFAKMTGPQRNWFRPEAFAALPDDLVIATSEVGLVGVLAPNKTIHDLAGLNDPSIAHGKLSVARIFEGGSPDVIYFPHPDYREVIQGLLEAPQITDYDLYPPSSVGTLLGLAIKKSSPYYGKMREIVGNRAPVAPEHYDNSLKLQRPASSQL